MKILIVTQDMLVKKFTFDDLKHLEELYFSLALVKNKLSFTNAVAELAEVEGHHPKLILEWGLVYVSWWTHKINAICKAVEILKTKNDFICVSKK